MIKITAHTIVKNEDQWIWYALNSVLPYVEQILVFDTGSTDKTVEIIRSINSPKIIFEQKTLTDVRALVSYRQKQIDNTKTDWFFILDGDEIWPQKQLKKLLEQMDQSPHNTIAFFNKVKNCIGDVYHYLPEEVGKYEICGVRGNLNIRLIKKTPSIKVKGSYPLEYYQNESGPIQQQCQKINFADVWYLHTTYLNRSSVDKNKVSGSFGRSRFWEKGLKMPPSEIPEIFYQDHPNFVASPFKIRGLVYETISTLFSPLINFKRKLL